LQYLEYYKIALKCDIENYTSFGGKMLEEV
jgi:hypothetical protein